jgi:hypothetical protein
MKFLGPNAHDAVFCPETCRLGEILWHLLKADKMMEEKCYRRVKEGRFVRYESTTEFGKEVGRDEIHWWIFEKENDLDSLRARSQSALRAAEHLKADATELNAMSQKSYGALLMALRQFTETHHADIENIHDYLVWLRQRDLLAPCILFTYRVWGSTRRGIRSLDLRGDNPQDENQETTHALTEIALGLRVGMGWFAFDRALIDVGSEIYDSDPYQGDEQGDEITIPEDQVVARASWRVLAEFAVFFEFIRNSLRNVLLDIEKCISQRNLMHSDAFWRRFVLAAVQTKKTETQLWDFKETLTAWHAKGEAKNQAKVTFAEDVASFANAEGGVLIVGVNNNREIVGIGSGSEAESRLKFARDILAERLDYPREVVSFYQVIVPNGSGGEGACLVITVVKTIEAVGVGDGAGQFTYPVRRETGISRESRRDIDSAKQHLKSDSHDFMEKLEQFVRDSHS